MKPLYSNDLIYRIQLCHSISHLMKYEWETSVTHLCITDQNKCDEWSSISSPYHVNNRIMLIIKGCSIAMKEKALLAGPGTAHNYALKWPGAPLPWCLHCHTLFVYNQLDSQAWGGMAEHLRVTVKLNFMNKLLWLIRPVSHVTPGPGWRHFISGELVFMVPLWVG